jgi:hypothetical protein
MARAYAIVVLLAGCGRLGFSDNAIADAGPDAPAPCAHACSIDLPATTTCTSPMVATFAAGEATVAIDMTGLAELEIDTQICDPIDCVLHLGDSPTDNGYGGDSGQFSNDAEIQILNTQLDVFPNQMAPGAGTLESDPSFVAATGCSSVVMFVRDQTVDATLPHAYHVASPFALRIAPPSDLEGVPDSNWWLGIDRTYGDPTRTGTGITHVDLCQR